MPTGIIMDVKWKTYFSKSREVLFDKPGIGNLLSRSDGLRNLTETFTYDNVDRLTIINGTSP